MALAGEAGDNGGHSLNSEEKLDPEEENRVLKEEREPESILKSLVT